MTGSAIGTARNRQPGFRGKLIERGSEDVDDLADLRIRNDKRRADHEMVTMRPPRVRRE